MIHIRRILYPPNRYNHMQRYYTTLAAVAVAFLLASPQPTQAADIQYGTLKDQKGSRLLLEYKSPAGTAYHTCDTSTLKCKKKGATPPALFPSLLGSKEYVTSVDGALAVRTTTISSATYHVLYDLSGKKPKRLTIIPFTNASAKVSFSKDGSAVIFTSGRTYTRYDIAQKMLTTVTLPRELAFVQHSPKATYVTGYNYTTLHHEVWRFSDGTMLQGPEAMQSYLEFSEDESRVAFLDDVDGFRTLFTMSANELGKSSTPSRTQLTKPKTETEDYIFVGTTLYFMANVDGPLEWDLWSYDGKKTSLVATDVSYGDYLTRVPTKERTYLAYLKTTGKNTNLWLVSPNPAKPVELAAVKASPLPSTIKREVKVYAGRTGVLLSPAKPAKSPALFIWMHGGPQRQVAKGYHPYLSYAVYDELLERLVAGGNYVYKIDYTGSTGYGAEFRKALDMNIGNTEMRDIRMAAQALRSDLKLTTTYLIGNSYGGYMALRAIVDTPETLDGVVSINGVSDWYGLIQQIPSSPFKELFNGVPDTTNMDAYLQASVYTGMEKLKKEDKVLVVWGERDGTVPVWQSTKYVEYAKTKGVNVETLSFPEEEHIIRDRKNLDTLCKKVVSSLGLKGISCAL